MSIILSSIAFDDNHSVGHATCQSASPLFNPDKPSFYMITAFCTIAILLLLLAVLSLLLIQLRALSKQLSLQLASSQPQRRLYLRRRRSLYHPHTIVSLPNTLHQSDSSTPPPLSSPHKQSYDQGVQTPDWSAHPLSSKPRTIEPPKTCHPIKSDVSTCGQAAIGSIKPAISVSDLEDFGVSGDDQLTLQSLRADGALVFRMDSEDNMVANVVVDRNGTVELMLKDGRVFPLADI